MTFFYFLSWQNPALILWGKKVHFFVFKNRAKKKNIFLFFLPNFRKNLLFFFQVILYQDAKKSVFYILKQTRIIMSIEIFINQKPKIHSGQDHTISPSKKGDKLPNFFHQFLRWCHQIWHGHSWGRTEGIFQRNFGRPNAISDYQSDFQIHFFLEIFAILVICRPFFFKVPKSNQITTKY